MNIRIKWKAAAAAVWMLVLLLSSAAAQTLPGIECFSPGLVRVSALEAEGAPVTAEASITIDKAMYARDLSVLGDMLSGMTFSYTGTETEERLILSHGGETLAVYEPDFGAADPLLDGLTQALCGSAILERVPLERVAQWLEGLDAGDSLGFGFAVVEPVRLERTMSDDGTRLTKISFLSGSIARGGQAPYSVTGFMRQPAGRAPKDTFELVLMQDERNRLELSYSALRESEIAKKNRQGTMSVRTAIKAAGKLAGYDISSRLSVNLRNNWTADGENLNEKITISAALSHKDNTPGRRMMRLNQAEAESKNIIRLKTQESGNARIELTDEVTMDVTMDGNAFLAAGAKIQAVIGGDAPQSIPLMPVTVEELSAKIYRRMSEKAQAKAMEGLK
ncbi:MAG: hypothetical protein IKK34_11390 [Clostridia bacterium]|nr:hypothetical protein [Clostridia bacterium]